MRSFAFDHWIDGLLVLFIVGTAYRGYKDGGLRALGYFVALVVGFLVGKQWGRALADMAALFLPFLNADTAYIIVFFLLFGIASQIVRAIFWLADKLFMIVTMLPIVSFVHQAVGGLIGAAQGIFVVGSVSYVVISLHLSSSWMAWISRSVVAQGCQAAFYRLLGWLV